MDREEAKRVKKEYSKPVVIDISIEGMTGIGFGVMASNCGEGYHVNTDVCGFGYTPTLACGSGYLPYTLDECYNGSDAGTGYCQLGGNANIGYCNSGSSAQMGSCISGGDVSGGSQYCHVGNSQADLNGYS